MRYQLKLTSSLFAGTALRLFGMRRETSYVNFEGGRLELRMGRWFHHSVPLEEIAAILDIEVGAVKSRLHRARTRLKRILTPYFQGSKAQ